MFLYADEPDNALAGCVIGHFGALSSQGALRPDSVMIADRGMREGVSHPSCDILA